MAKKTPTKRRGDEGNKLAKRRSRLKYAYPIERDPDDTLGMYLKEVGSLPLLKAEQEVTLAKRIERGIKAREELASGRSGSKQVADLKVLIEDGWAAREHLLTANSRLVISVAKKYRSRGVPFADLIQEGNIGLIRATKKFEYRRGLKFSTYATWWIRQAVTRAISDMGRTIRLPVHMGDQINRLLRASHNLTQELGRNPTNAELAEVLDVPLERIEDMKLVSQLPISLETPTSEEEDSVLGDFIEDQEAEAPADAASEALMFRGLWEALGSLPPRESVVLKLRFGLVDGKVYTLEEVGQKLGVTRERARQIEAQGMRRFQNPDIREKLVDYVKE
ncbi:MAG: sigma-70 family RNA polymerase sigma factor [Chloroflexi bacterium]|nr:sigma-70 family RNA polymerase sigma factor [Chloroflexota bacterium]